MKWAWKVALLLGMASPLVAAEKPDVQTIVNKANIVAYYQGKDGKATVKMTITSKQGQKRTREFNSVSCPSSPNPGSTRCLAYRSSCRGVKRDTSSVIHFCGGKAWLFLMSPILRQSSAEW